MVKLKTEVILPEFPVKLSYRRESLMMGSCFTESIGTYLRELLFPIEVNPFGILYNPISIANSLEILLTEKYFTPQDLFYANGLWNSFYHHSRFSNPDQAETLNQINNKIKEASEILGKCHLLFFTFGTSWVFEDIKSARIVSNCHKLPASTFSRYRLSPSEITERWKIVTANLLKVNPTVNIVFTVSPIRHLKDGLHENQLSKASLLMAIDELQKYFGKEQIHYFPSYEILLDELRDYRFYASDMVHLNEVGIDLIREKFAGVFIEPEDRKILPELEKVLQALNHRPLHPDESGFQNFINKQIEKIHQLKSKYPFLNLEPIIKQFDFKKGVFNF